MSRFFLLIGLCLVPILTVAEPPHRQTSPGSGLNGKVCRELTPAEQKRLVVEWGKPRLAPRNRSYGTRIAIPGQAFLKSADGKTKEPLKGIVVASVIVAVKPETKPD